jgi:hypothetical protein
MKKLTLCIITLIGLMSFNPGQGMASNTTPAPVGIEMSQGDKSRLARLEEIRNMDMSGITSAEKKALRKEVRASKRQMDGGGVYLSVGAIIIIILLLILLL